MAEGEQRHAMDREPVASGEQRKLCPACGLPKPRIAFNRDARGRDGLFLYCKECRRELRRTKYREDKDYSHARAVKKNYGLSPEEYRAMFEELLCDGCNRGLGSFKDDPKRIERAGEYLRKWL